MRMVLETRELRYAYQDGTVALSGATLELSEGERAALLGRNGAGKTTLLLAVLGLIPAEGDVLIGGVELSPSNAAMLRRQVGLVFQDPDDQLFMATVAEDVAFGPANTGVSGPRLEELVDTALESVGLGGVGDRSPHHLSGGEARRAAIAGVLAMKPEVLVLDEPTSNLDPAGRRALVGLLRGISAAQLVVTHDLSFAAELCPRAIVMDGGRVVADGAMATMLADSALMERHGLELPYGFDPASIAAR